MLNVGPTSPFTFTLVFAPRYSVFIAAIRSGGRLKASSVSHMNWCTLSLYFPRGTLALMLTRATSGPVVVDGESFLDALFASAGQG